MSVYFIQEAEGRGRIKIGVTTDFRSRFSGIQTGSPSKLKPILLIQDTDSYELERVLHCEFNEYRLRGEWFRFGDKIKQFLDDPQAAVPQLKAKHAKNGPRGINPVKCEVPIEYVAFAKWLLSNPQVVEIMLISSDLPTITTLETEAELDSGAWFLCRVDLESLGESIVSFVKQV